ncbi:hypothetical protein MVI01_57040 [Myxococcus virescens]|uniref:Uncharacterized protein n=1 Tax=Myxococcus virescens TaxID=83456 RepID=A0A511HK22_9BACT|nr:hypothetical protein MVI01_57040 [Myxococcus virescens]
MPNARAALSIRHMGATRLTFIVLLQSAWTWGWRSDVRTVTPDNRHNNERTNSFFSFKGTHFESRTRVPLDSFFSGYRRVDRKATPTLDTKAATPVPAQAAFSILGSKEKRQQRRAPSIRATKLHAPTHDASAPTPVGR